MPGSLVSQPNKLDDAKRLAERHHRRPNIAKRTLTIHSFPSDFIHWYQHNYELLVTFYRPLSTDGAPNEVQRALCPIA